MKSFAPATLLLLSFALLLPGLGGKNSPGQGDEVMHLLTVQSSLEAKSYLIPVLDGQPNYYKPPLLFWAGMATEAVFSSGLFGGRLSSVLFTAGTVLLIYFLLTGARIDWRIALLAALAYVLTLGAMKFGRLLMMEQGMAFSFLLIVFFLFKQIRTGKLRYALLAGLVSGLAFLFKGPLFIVYTGLLYSVWAMTVLFRVSREESGWVWHAQHHVAYVAKTAAAVIAASLVVPGIWVASILAFAGEEGAVLLKFFFVVENLGKFMQENQNTFRLLGGWLTYTFPWTLVLLAGMAAVFLPQRLTNRNQYFGRILILSVFTIMIFHLLPHRKAAYYGVPFMPLVFVGIPLLLRDLTALERPARWTILSLYVVAPILTLAAVLGSESAIGLVILLPALAAVVLERLSRSSWSGASMFARNRSLKIVGIAGSMSMLTIQFALYPLLNHEVIPVARVGSFPGSICVVTGETWDAMDLKVLRPDIDVAVTVPMSPETCVDGRRAVLHIPGAPTEESMIDVVLEQKAYTEIGRWNMWSRRLTTDAVIEYLQGGRRIVSRIRYYEPSH